MHPKIDDLQRAAAADPSVIGLAGGLPSPDQFPRRALTQAFLEAVGSAPALQYGWPEGSEALRARIAGHLAGRGVEGVGPHDVIITHGAQQALALALSVATDAGDTIGVDPYSYPAALDLFRTRERALVPHFDADLVYVMPAVGNPSGRAMGSEQRRELLRGDRLLIEDDAYAELRFDDTVPRPLVADARDRVFHVGTFSKVLCPGLRIGWLVPPRRFRDRVVELKAGNDLQAGSLAQRIVEEVLARPGYAGRLRRLRRFYRRRAQRMARAVREHLPGWRFEPPEGGFTLWVETDRPYDEVALLERAVAEGVSFDPGSMFAVEPGEQRRLRLCYSWAKPRCFDEGVRRLAKAAAEL